MQGTPAVSIEVALSRATLSIIEVVDALITQAHALRASDIHIDPTHTGVRVRLRIDGVLQETCTLPKRIHAEVIARIKVLAGMRTDEHQAAQDGRFRYHFAREGELLDMRISIVPTYHGENAVLRLLSNNAADFSLETLGFTKKDEEKIVRAIARPHGMILSTGPTGSGKTTTLYTLMKMLNQGGISLVTIEDPIEYAVDDVEQIQVNVRAGLTFANGLRSILRQDPNIIMVGEIRDAETASIAVNTALTGHLLLSTLHTNNAATTLPRLLDMGIDPYLVASTINIAIGQRLVRKLCEQCKERSGEFYIGRGCMACNDSGYAGRVCLSEVLVADTELREAIMRKASADELQNIAIAQGMTTMQEDGLAKARAGETSLQEVLRVVHE